jgi:hypothetical protein
MQRPAFQLAAVAVTVITLAACAAAADSDRLDNPDLERVRTATLKYRTVDSALAAGYEDINVVMPRMGRHYLNKALLDNNFDPEKPELLVYVPEGNGMKLVAAEYAVPVDTTNLVPPEGFAGSDDVWERNEQFGIWTLHAWVHQKNPDGIFAAFNPTVP